MIVGDDTSAVAGFDIVTCIGGSQVLLVVPSAKLAELYQQPARR